jgi:hypothetical protein
VRVIAQTLKSKKAGEANKANVSRLELTVPDKNGVVAE